MADWPRYKQGSSRVVISVLSPESLGGELDAAMNGAIAATAAWPAANRAIHIPFVVLAPFMAMQMAWVNGSIVNNNFSAGIHDDNGNQLVVSAATAQAGASAVQAADLTDTVIMPGSYYMSLSRDVVGTGTMMRYNPAVVLCKALGVMSQSTAYPLPSPATFAAAQDIYIPFLAVFGRTLI